MSDRDLVVHHQHYIKNNNTNNRTPVNRPNPGQLVRREDNNLKNVAIGVGIGLIIGAIICGLSENR